MVSNTTDVEIYTLGGPSNTVLHLQLPRRPFRLSEPWKTCNFTVKHMHKKVQVHRGCRFNDRSASFHGALDSASMRLLRVYSNLGEAAA